MQKLIEKLTKEHAKFNNKFPSLREAHEFLIDTLGLLFPHLSCENPLNSAEEYSKACKDLGSKLERILSSAGHKESTAFAGSFISKLDSLYDQLLSDAESILAGDPAAKSIDEVISAYPGFLAIAVHRIAHEFYLAKIEILPRLFSEYAHKNTGIDIHPGAKIGNNFCIDHGTGIVIGETTVIKNNVKIYQGVTLGALSVEKSLAHTKRHPTIEDNVVIYANATILGGETVVGKNSIIGGNVWITDSIAENSMVYHSSENKIKAKLK